LQRVLSTVTLLGLLVATAAAFAITEHLKLIKSPIFGTRVSKAFSTKAGTKASIGFRLRHGDHLTVTIVDSSRHTVDTVAADVYRAKGYRTFQWDGMTDSGTPAPDGSYQPQIKLENARRTILLPNVIELVTTTPQVVSVSAGKGFFVPGAKRTIRIRYVLSKEAHAVVYLGTKRIILGRPTRTHGEVKWNGLRGGSALPPGRYVLSLGALDVAGNETPAGGRQTVEVVLRDIALTPTRIDVRRGARFTVGVATAAPKYAWRLAGKHGTGRGKVLRLRAPSRRGKYRLVVKEGHHATSAIVNVGRHP
jgi:flagellar hook capping protein FlgD